MENSILNNNANYVDPVKTGLDAISMGIRTTNRRRTPIASINTEYDRSLNNTPIDDYEALYEMTKDDPSQTLQNYDWISDASTAFMNSRDNINIMTAGGKIVKDVIPTIEDINFELDVLNDKKRLRELENIIPSLQEGSNEYNQAVSEYNYLSNSVNDREDQYNEILKKYGEEEGNIDERINYLNESKESWLNEKADLENEINSLRSDIEKRGEASAQYRLLEQRNQDSPLTDSDYWKYSVPTTAGSSFATVAGYVGGAALSAMSWAGKKLAQNAILMSNPYSAAIGAASGVIDATAAVGTIALDLYSRDRESYAQVYGAYKEKVKKDLEDQGVDVNNYISAAKEQILANNPDIKPNTLTDDSVLDRILTGEVNIDDATLANVSRNAKQGLDTNYWNNMALSIPDIAVSAAMFAPVRGLLSKTFGTITKPVTNLVKNSKVYSKVNKALDDYAEFNARLAFDSPKKYAATEAAKTLAKIGFAATEEMFEEGNQDIYDYDYINNRYDDKSAGLLSSISNLVNANYRTAKILSGIDTESELANDPQFWNDVKGGFALGLLMGGPMSAVQESVGTYKDMKANKLVKEVIADQITNKDIMDKSKLYSQFATNNRLNYNENVIKSLEKYKNYVDPEAITEADIDEEIKFASNTLNLAKSKANKEIAKKIGISYGSEDYNTLVGLQNVAVKDYQDAVDNSIKAVKSYEEFGQKLFDNASVKSLPEEDRNTAVALTQLNAAKEGIARLRESITGESTKEKFGITSKDNPIAKRLLQNLKQEEAKIDAQIEEVAKDSKFDKDYVADPSVLDEGASHYVNVLLADADKKVSLGKKNEIFGSAIVNGKLTNFNKLDPATQSKVGNRIKTRIDKYLNNQKNSAEIANKNAEKLVREESAKSETTPTNIPPASNTQTEPKSNIMSPNPKTDVDTTIPSPQPTTEPVEVYEDDVEIPIAKDDSNVAKPETKSTPSLEEIAAEFEKRKQEAIEEVKPEKPEVKAEEKSTPEPAEQQKENLYDDPDDDFIDLSKAKVNKAPIAVSNAVDKEGTGEEIVDIAASANKVDTKHSNTTVAQKEEQMTKTLSEEQKLQEADEYGDYDDFLAELETSLEGDLVSRTLFANLESDKPMIPGYKSGKELAKLLEQPGSFAEATFEYIINESFKGSGDVYIKGKIDTYGNAPLLLVIHHPTGDYLMAFKTPEGARTLMKQKGKSEQEIADAISKLESYRNVIIEVIENKASNQKVVPTTVRRSNGVYNKNITVTKEGVKHVHRPLQDNPSFEIYNEDGSLNENVVFGVGRGIGKTGQADKAILDKDGVALPGKGGSGSLFIYPKANKTISGALLPVQVNVSRFTKAAAIGIVKLLNKHRNNLEEGVSGTNVTVNNLLKFIVRFGLETKIASEDARVKFLIDKQFYVDENGWLIVGSKVYKNLGNLSDEQINEIADRISATMHWRINRDNFWGNINDAIPGLVDYFRGKSKDARFEIVPGFYITKEQSDSNMPVIEFMLQNKLLQTNLKDNLFTNPFVHADGIIIISEDSVTPEKLNEAAGEASSMVAAGSSNALPINDQSGIESKLDNSLSQNDIEQAKRNAENGIDLLNDWGGPYRTSKNRKYTDTISPEEIEWVKNKLGISSDQIEVIENAIALGNDTFAMGLARAYSIVLWKGAEVGTAYHEAFHRVSLLLLTPRERKRMYEMYRNRTGAVGDDKLIEEYLAEDFREYMLNNADTETNIVKRAFKAIKNFVNKWVFHTDTTIDNIFDRISSGHFSRNIVNKQSLEEFKANYQNIGAPFTYKNYKFKYITNPQFSEVVDSLTAVTIKANGIQSDDTATEVDFSKVKAALYPDVTRTLVEAGKVTEEQAKVRDEIYDSFDTVFRNEIIKKLRSYQLRDIDRIENQEEETIAKANGETVGDQMSAYTKDSIEISTKKNALASVKILVGTLPKLKFKSEGSTEVEPVISPITGLMMCEKYDEAWNVVMNNLHDCNTLDEMLQRCSELSSTYPIFSALYKKLSALTTPVEGESETNRIAKENLATQIRNTFRKAKNNIVGLISSFEQSMSGSRLSKIFVRSENSGKEVKLQITGWTNELIRNSSLIKFVDNKYTAVNSKIDETIKVLDAIVNFVNNYKTNPNALTKEGITRRENFTKKLQSIKTNVLLMLSDAGVKIDQETLDAYVKKYQKGSELENWAAFFTDSSTSSIKAFITNTIGDLKTIDNNGRITREIGKKKVTYNISSYYSNNGFLKGIAEVYNTLNPNPTEMAVLASDGKLLYPISDHNYLSDMTQNLNKGGSILEKLSHVMYITGKNDNPNYFKGSKLLTALFNSKSKDRLKVATFAYFKQAGSRDRGRKYMEVSTLEDYVMKMALTQQGYALLPTMGDSGTYNVLFGEAVSNFKNPLVLAKDKDGKTTVQFSADILSQMISYFETELDTVKKAYADEHILEEHPERQIKNYHNGKRNGYRFRYFTGFFKENGEFTNFNEALEAAEKLDKESKSRDNVNNVLAKIENDWNKFSDSEKLAMMNQYVMNSFIGELNYAQEIGLIEWDGKHFASVKNKSLPETTMKEASSHYSGMSLDSKVQNALGTVELLANYFANSISNNIEFEKLYIKDPAYYKDPVDKTKRLREALSTGVVPRTDYEPGHELAGITEVNVGMLKDNEAPSKELLRINKLAKRSVIINLLQTMKGMSELDAVNAYNSNNIPEDVEDSANVIVEQKFGGYGNVNQTDATVLISPDMYKQLVRRVDGWTPEVQRAFEILNDPDADYAGNPDLYNEALAVTMKPLKFMYFGDHFDEELGLDIPIFDKMAMFPVHRIFSTGDLAEVFKVMTNPNKPIHMLAFESAVKVGQYNSKPGIYTDTDNTEINVEGLGNISTHKQSLTNFRRQLITDPHHSETNMFVTQAQKAASGNIRRNNTYVTPSGETLTGQQVIDNIKNTMNALTEKGRQSVEERFGIEYDENGNPTADFEKFANTLAQDAESSDMNQNVLDGLQVENGKTKAPISGLSDNSWIESRLISILDKDIIDNNLPGGMFIQMSSIAYNKIVVRSASDIKNGPKGNEEGSLSNPIEYNGEDVTLIKGNHYSQNGVIFACNENVQTNGESLSNIESLTKVRRLRYCNSDGSMDAVISINLLKHIIPDYNNKTFAEAKQWLIDNNVIGTESSIAAMGYRIPAQGQSSTVALKIVDVYPEQIGDTITLPDEFTALTGSDFDIDKLFIARYHYDSNGNKVRFITKEEKLASTEERLRKAGFDDEYIAKELYKIKQQNEYELNSKEALENRLLDMYISVISNVNNFSEVRQPLDTVTDYLKNHILADVDNLTGAKKKDSKASALYFATPQFQSRTKSELSGGKNGIAPFALAASHHSLTQQVGLRLIPNKILKKFGITDIAGIQSKRNNYHKGFEAVNVNILDWLSAMINAHVDVAKDPYIIRLNVRKLTFNMTNFLIRTGQGESTLYFLPQQILKDFATEYDRYSGFYGVDLPEYKNPENVAFENTRKKYIEAAKKAAKGNKNLEAEIEKLSNDRSSAVDSEIMDINWLRKQLDVSSKYYKSFDWYYNQLRILYTYDQLSTFAKELSELTALSQIDTKKFGNNFGLQSSFLARWSTFLSESKVFDKPVRMLTDTFLYKKLTDGVIFPRRAFRNVMLRLTPEFDFWRNKLLVMTGNIGTKNDDVINAITRSMEAYYKSAFFDKYCTDNNININDLLYGSNSIVNRFNDIKNKALSGAYPELLGSDGKFTNVLFRTLIPRQKFDKVDLQMPDFFELKMNKDADDNVDNLMIRAWEELMDSNSKEVRDFAKDLAVYAFYTSGDAFGRNNFFKYVPNSLREELGYFDYLRNLENNPSELVQFERATNKVFRNLWWNEDIVPTIEWIREKEVFESGQLETIQDKLPNEPSGYTVTDDNGTELEIPGLIVNNRRAKTIGSNAAGDIIYSPYVKIKLNGTNDPRFVMLYRFVGVQETKQGIYPVYKLIPKFGVNYQGMTVVEFGSKLSSLPFNNYNYSGAVPFDGFRAIKDIIPQSLNTLNAINDIVNTVENQNSLTEIPQQIDQEQTTEQQETINIYAGTGENSDLSNFAVRPFKYESFEPTATVGDSILFGSTKEVNRVITFNTVEGAFQAQKLAYAAIPQTEKEELENRLSKASGAEAREIGKSIQNLDKESWDRVSSSIMKDLITASFEQNPDALQILLSTGNAILTHKQDKGKWGTEFPRILMEVRDELRSKNQEKSIAVPTTKIISGGQTGIDRLGLEVGKELGLETGGTTTPGFYTENGKDESLRDFGVVEISPELQAGRKGKEFYLPRTEQNVLNSDGTVYFATNDDSAGRIATERFAKKHNKPFLLNPTSEQLAQWLYDNNIQTLNVAGNRGSKVSPEFDAKVRETLRGAFASPVQQDLFNQEQSTIRKTYSGKITTLEPNQIFVFGSNTQGRHGKGAALIARNNFGAIYGQAEGIQGQSYAIITKDLTKATHPSRTPEQIKEQIHKLYEYARQNPDKEFLVAYSGTGANLNAYSNQEMANMFSSEQIPSNIVFEEEFNKLVQEQTVTETSTPTSSQSQLASEFDKFVADNSVPVEVAEQIKSELPKAEDKAEKVNDDGRTYTFNNGFKVNLKFKLNEQQIAALRELENFIEDDTAQTITLSGYAGTGKTTIISILRQYLDTITLGRRLIFSAPTHRANYVTKMMSPDAKVITLASLFGFTLDVDLSLNKYDLNTLKAKQKGEAKINNGSLIIIDEASMIQDSLYSLIQEQLQMLPRTKIIFVGDAGQLRPVESKTKSKVFSDQDTPLVQLTKVERTGDNPILKESTRVRNGEGFSYQTEVDRYGNGVKYSNDVTTIEDYIKSNLSDDRFRNNKLFFKILAGTNAAVSKYNQMARDVLYGNRAKFIEVGELITGYANKLRQMDGTFGFINSGDYIVTDTEDKEVVIKTSSGIVTFNATKCKMLNALDIVSNEISLTFINPSPSEKSKLVQVKNYIDELWSEYREAKRRGDITRQRVSLRRINEISEQINVLENVFDSDGRLIFSKTADYGYASTIHKSQGGTYNKVLIDDSSIESFRGGSDIKQELRYVAVSRASEDVMVATSKASNQKNTEFDDFDDYIVVEDLSKAGEQRKNECK